MTTIPENKELDNISFDEIDSIEITEAVEIIKEVESNTKWEDTSKHMMHNGAKMNC